jgi:hypothetical protein
VRDHETWVAVDNRTGRRVGMSSIGFTLEQAERTIEGWRERDRRGGRPDLHVLLPYLEPRLSEDALE